MFVGHMCAVFLYLFIKIEESLCQESDCTTPDGSTGICIQIEECHLVLNIVLRSPKPLPLDVANTLNTYTCGWYNNKPKVCCKGGPNVASDKRLTDLSAATVKQPEDVSTHSNLKLLPIGNCGFIADEKISNGNITVLFEFPWMVLLQYRKGETLMFSCGGSLISDRYVLTAAHCVTKLEPMITLVGVRLGEHNISSDNDCHNIDSINRVCAPQVQDISVEEVVFHPLYNKPKRINDVAVIRLARAANMAANVRPICLPTTFNAQNIVLINSIIAGWGLTENQHRSSVLLKATLPIVSNDICQRRLQTFQQQQTSQQPLSQRRSPINLIEITENHLCAGGNIGVDSCSGDSGGPLMHPNNGNMVQFGIVSFGVRGCSGSHDYPGVYVKVAYYMRWILDQLKP